MKIKTIMQGSFFIVLCCSAGLYLFSGEQGIRNYLQLKKEFDQEKTDVEKLEQEVKEIELAIQNWQADPIERERVARQDLSMSYPNELVYLTPQDKHLSQTTNLASAQ